MVVHHRKELAEYKDNQPACHSDEYREETAKHIDVLLNFIQENLGAALELEEARHKRNPPVATFEYLWLMFRPGEDVYTVEASGRRKAAGILYSVGSGADGVGVSPYCINYWRMAFQGSTSKMAPTKGHIIIHPFSGERKVQSLNRDGQSASRQGPQGSQIYPARLHTDNLEELKAKNEPPRRELLIEQGHLYWRISKQAYMEYTGPVGDKTSWIPGKVTGRVIVDAVSWDKFNPPPPPPPPPPPQRVDTFPPPPRRHPSHSRARPRNYRGSRGPVRQIPAPSAADFLSYGDGVCRCDSCAAMPNREIENPWQDYLGLEPASTHQEAPTHERFYLICHDIISGYLLSKREWGKVWLLVEKTLLTYV